MVTSAEPTDASPEPRPRRLKLMATLTTSLFLVGLLVRITVRDHLPLLSTVFYALPLPVLTVLAAVTALILRRLGRTRGARIWWLTTLLALVWCAWALTFWHAPTDRTEQPVRILCWNTCRGWFGWDRVAEAIDAIQPDVAGLVEAGPWSDERRAFWRESCPGYHVSLLGGGFVCLTKEPPGEGNAVQLPDGGQIRRLDVTVRGETFTLLIVDLKSNPLTSRKAALAALANDAAALTDRPVVILGDFNTPSESVHFGPLRQAYRHAFEVAGSGYVATWPLPVPVLCLDHLWVNRNVRVEHCEHLWSTASDHRPVVAEVTILR